jgi:fructoselysine-6-P-deglycase FrlB-like protein
MPAISCLALLADISESVSTGATDVIGKAANHSWESGLVALAVIVGGSLVAWQIRRNQTRTEKREDTDATRLQQVENFTQTTLVDLVKQAVIAISQTGKATETLAELVAQLKDTMQTRTCMLTPDQQTVVLERVLDELVRRAIFKYGGPSQQHPSRSTGSA